MHTFFVVSETKGGRTFAEVDERFEDNNGMRREPTKKIDRIRSTLTNPKEL
jgi:hypothetical protein